MTSSFIAAFCVTYQLKYYDHIFIHSYKEELYKNWLHIEAVMCLISRIYYPRKQVTGLILFTLFAIDTITCWAYFIVIDNCKSGQVYV
jgi:hypothetical protein